MNKLLSPDDFKNDWYGELTNQAGHTLLGIVAVALFCFAAVHLSGQMPSRILALTACAAPYLLMEWKVQGWKSGDSWFDSAMFIIGVLGPLVVFSEVSAAGDLPLVAVNHKAGMMIIAVWLAFMAPRILKRAKTTGNPQYKSGVNRAKVELHDNERPSDRSSGRYVPDEPSRLSGGFGNSGMGFNRPSRHPSEAAQ